MDTSAFSITAFSLFSRVLHLVLFLLIGNCFGANETTDAVLLLQAPLLVLVSVTAGAAEAVVMPAMHRAFKADCAAVLLRVLVRRAIVFVAPASILILLVTSRVYRDTAMGLIAFLAPMPVLAALSSIHMGVLNSEGKYRRALLGPLYGSLVGMPLIFLLPPSTYSLACILLLFEFGRATGLWLHAGHHYRVSERNEGPVAERLIVWASRAALFQAVGSFLLALNPMVDVLFASTLGTGAVTNVEYANRLWNAVPLLLSGQLMLVYAVMSRAASHGQIDRRQVHLNALKLGAVASALSIVAIAFSGVVIDLLYGFGKMEKANLNTLADLLRCYLIGAGPFLAGLVYVRALSAEGRTKIMRNVATVSVLVNIVLNIVLIRAYGLNGIGLATSIAYSINTILLAFLFSSHSGFIEARHDENRH
jgi:putative peptidoglycan lipid II flippase